ncbi:MAG: ribose-phosphate pyrophosphokinase [Flavobacteriales bacterium]|jgi:ribose-phosphate pyrophosphokinase|nr:ribose-phosphate pyrophosphokinase [Flavobacteriales bacterium]MBT6746242.1 ribose-phosphate pyrophosphokinase [Flavobacteriales bacterium]
MGTITERKRKIFVGSASPALGKAIAAKFGVAPGDVELQRFSDGEFQTSLEETVRGAHVFFIQSTFPPTDNLFELLLMVDAAKRASAAKITVVMPYFGWARQDRKDKPRVAIGSKLIVNMLESAGVTRVITMDLHADQIQGFFEVPVDHLYASSVFIPYIEKLTLPNLIMGAPDTGGTKRANAYAKHLGCGMVICYKQRKKANEVSGMTLIGDVEGKDVIIVDDIIDTAGTITKAADMMMSKGANSVRALITHPVLSGPAYERIENSSITELITTDSIPLKQESSKINVISVANLFAEVMQNVVNHQSISSNFII